MKPNTPIGLGLLALAAGAGWYWWKNKAATAAAAGKAEATKPFNAFGSGQIGSNFQTDNSPEILALTLDYTRKIIDDAKPCWQRVEVGRRDGNVGWSQNGTNNFILIPEGARPETGRVC